MRREFTVPTDAADEAKRRLLRDLHDGLGPSLAAVALGLRAARHLARHDPASAGRLLARLEDEVHSAVAEVRRLASGAYPAALARLGLVGAVRAHVASLTDRHPVRVDVECAGLPELPVAVQVAAYRIVCEALTNVVRHAGARHCTVRLGFDDRLHVEVVDDGVGAWPPGGVADGITGGAADSAASGAADSTPGEAPGGAAVGGASGAVGGAAAGGLGGLPSSTAVGSAGGARVGCVPGCPGGAEGTGVGLRSMRERAREVGGTWRVEHAAAGGTRVAADLPVAGGV